MQVKNGYKLKKEALLGSKTPTPKQKDIRPQQLQSFVLTTSVKKLKEISDTAAYKIADAENKSFLAAEAMKEAERILKMAEETELILHLVIQIEERCNNKNICTFPLSVFAQYSGILLYMIYLLFLGFDCCRFTGRNRPFDLGGQTVS